MIFLAWYNINVVYSFVSRENIWKNQNIHIFVNAHLSAAVLITDNNYVSRWLVLFSIFPFFLLLFFFYLSPLSLQSTRRDMAKLFWYARQMDSCTSKQSSRQCQDRWSSPRAAHCRICVARYVVGWKGGKNIWHSSLFLYRISAHSEKYSRSDRGRRITIMNSRYQSSVYKIPCECVCAMVGGRVVAALVSDRRNRAKTIIYDVHVILLLLFLF